VKKILSGKRLMFFRFYLDLQRAMLRPYSGDTAARGAERLLRISRHPTVSSDPHGLVPLPVMERHLSRNTSTFKDTDVIVPSSGLAVPEAAHSCPVIRTYFANL